MMTKLSSSAQSLWAKKNRDGNFSWLPLFVHLSDSAAVADKLWTDWLSSGVKCAISNDVGVADAKKLLIFLAACHDVGKATPVFQAKQVKSSQSELDRQIGQNIVYAGLPTKPMSAFVDAQKTPHALASQIILEREGKEVNINLRNIAVILGSHHGKPPSSDALNQSGVGVYAMNYHLGKGGHLTWTGVQKELIDYALSLAGYTTVEEIPRPNFTSQVLLSGLVIMADWIASNELYFPYYSIIDEPALVDMQARRDEGWKKLQLPTPWDISGKWRDASFFHKRFSINSSDFPNTIQTVIKQTAIGIDNPGILVLEAPMGSGKTEAALVAAEIFADKVKRSGIYFALPTQATSDGIFNRIRDWIFQLGGIHTIELAHSKAQFNDDFTSLQFLAGSGGVGLDDLQDGPVVNQWFEGSKKSLLADFVVGTIDQLLLAGLKQRHVMLRHLGLANKVVIIDECHAYDAYMNRYLEMVLHWLGAYHVPVIVLSATLPAQKRKMVIDAYLNTDLASTSQTGALTGNDTGNHDWVDNRSYPLITYSNGHNIMQKAISVMGKPKRVRLTFIEDDGIVQKLADLLSDGGCAGLIVNTVKRAQGLAKALRKCFGDDVVSLVHSRFLTPDRFEKEKLLIQELGKPDARTDRPFKRIVVGTQVLEQSLDIDFDILITDICPIDLLLQRIGRLHRHERNRPQKLIEAHCSLLGVDGEDFEAGTKFIYGEYILMRTKAMLPSLLNLPEDIPNLVQDVYSYAIKISPEPVGYHKAEEKWKKVIDDKEKRANDFRITQPWDNPRANMVDWLNTDVSDQQGEAAVRDTDESMEVLLILERNGRFYFMPWIEDGRELPADKELDDETAKALARQRLQLPRLFCEPWSINRTISELEQMNQERLGKWHKSPWVKGELVLVLDETCAVRLCGYHLVYTRDDGLVYEKEGGVNG